MLVWQLKPYSWDGAPCWNPVTPSPCFCSGVALPGNSHPGTVGGRDAVLQKCVPSNKVEFPVSSSPFYYSPCGYSLSFKNIVLKCVSLSGHIDFSVVHSENTVWWFSQSGRGQSHSGQSCWSETLPSPGLSYMSSKYGQQAMPQRRWEGMQRLISKEMRKPGLLEGAPFAGQHHLKRCPRHRPSGSMSHASSSGQQCWLYPVLSPHSL